MKYKYAVVKWEDVGVENEPMLKRLAQVFADLGLEGEAVGFGINDPVGVAQTRTNHLAFEARRVSSPVVVQDVIGGYHGR